MWKVFGLLMLPNDGGAGGGGGSGGAPSGSSGGSAPSAPSTSGPAPGAVNIGSGGSSGGNASDAQHDVSADKPDPSKPVAQKFKVKRGGKEAEYDADTLAKMVSDDYEDEFPGAGGKPMKLRREEVARRVQLSEGAMTKMREANEYKARLAAEREAGKANIPAYLENHLGVEDYHGHIMREANRFLQQERQLNALSQRTNVDGTPNPNYNISEYHRQMELQARQKFERKQALEQARAQAEQRQVEQRGIAERRQNAIGGALREGKLPVNNVTMQIAESIVQEHIAADHELTAATLQSLTRQRFHELMHSYMDSLDEDGTRGFLGDDRRAKFREFEVRWSKAQKKEARAETAPVAPITKPNGQNGKTQYTAADMRREIEREFGGGR